MSHLLTKGTSALKRLFSVLAIALALVHSLPVLAAVQNATSTQLVVIKGAFADQLKDPDSAKLKDVQIATDGTLCGHVNAKNSYGAYTGYRTFHGLYFDKDKNGNPVAIILAIDSEDSPVAQIMCAKKGM
jgi:hypothetical protein